MIDKNSNTPPLISDENSSDLIPVLDQVVAQEKPLPREDKEHANLGQENIDQKKLSALRKSFENEMNKKIRRTLQETERHLQKELQNHLDQLFKQL